MAKLVPVDFDPFGGAAPASEAVPKLVPVNFDPFATTPPDERELNLPPLEGEPAEGIPLPPERERPVPLPTARPKEEPKESATQRTLAAIGDIPEAVLRGYYSAKQGINLLGLETGQYTPEEAAAGIAASQIEARKNAMPESIRKGMEALQKAKGWKESVATLAEHPDVLPSVLGESIASSLVSTGTGLIGALTGAAVGSVVPIVGTAAGATTGLAAGTGLGSAATEYASSLNDFLTSQGIDTSNPEQLKAAFLNSKIMDAARKDAATRGVAVGAFDALTAGVAGKLFSPVKKALGKGTLGAIAGTAAEIGAQAAGGAGGEAAAQLGTKGEIASPSDVLLEAAGEIIPGLGEIVISKVTGASPTEAEPKPEAEPAPEAPAAPPSPEQPVEAPGAEPSPPPEAAPPAAPVAGKKAPAPKVELPSEEDIAILKGAEYDIEQILDMSPREIKAKVKEAREGGVTPVALDLEDLAAIEAAKPVSLGEPVPTPEGLAPPEEAVAPAPEPVAPVGPAPRAAELVQEGVPPLEAIKEAGAAPIAPAPPVAPAPEVAPAPVAEVAPEPELQVVPAEPVSTIPRIKTEFPFAVHGGETEIKVGNTYLPARYAVVDAEGLKATLGKAANQFRQRGRDAAVKQMEAIANKPDWNQLNAAPIMDYGSPTLDRKGLVVGGNGRFEGLSRAYDRGTANNYRRLLQKNAGQFGIDPATFAKMKKPILARVIEADVDTKKLALASNEGGPMKMSAIEQSAVDAERLPDIGGVQINENGEISPFSNREFVKAWTSGMPDIDLNDISDKNGELSKTGITRLRNAIMYKVYGESPTLERIIESNDQGSKNLAATLVKSAAKSAKGKELIASGDMYNFDIIPDIIQAAEKFEYLRNEGEKIKDYLNQGQMFSSDISPEARKILQFFGDHMRSAKSMSQLINTYWDKAEAVGNPKQAGIFGEEAVPTKGELLDAALQDTRKVVPAAEAELPFGEVAPEPRAEAAPTPKEEPAPAPAPTPKAEPVAEVPAPAKEPSKSKKSPKSFTEWMDFKEQFSKSPNMPQEYLDVLADWAEMLGIKQKIHLILDGDKFDYSPYIEDKLSETTQGRRRYFRRENASVITLKLRPRKSFNLEVLAHELGHVFEIESWKNAPFTIRNAVLKDYEKFLEENKVKNIEDYIKALRSHVSGKLTAISPSFRNLPFSMIQGKDRAYLTSFEEYFAEQVAKYMMSEQRPQTIVGKYFARIADGLKRLYNSLAGMQGKASKSMKEYIDRRVNEVDNILDEEPTISSLSKNEIVNESRSTLSQDTIDEINELNKQTGMPQSIAPEQPKAPEETDFDKLRAIVQDDKTFVEKVIKHIEKIRNAPLPDFLNVYARMMLMPGRISERIHDLNQREIKPFFEKMKELNVTPDELHKYRLALHAKERNARMAQVDPEKFATLEGGGSGLTNEAADILLERAEPRKKELDELNTMLTKILDNDLDRRVEAGLISQEQADGYKEMYENYVPLRGFAERDFEEDFAHQKYNLGRGISLSKDEYKQAMGRTSLSDNVVFNALMQAEEGIYRIEKNRVGESLYNIAKNFKFPDLWKVGKMKTHREIGADGMVKTVLDGMVGPDTIVVKIGGKAYYVELVHPALKAAFGRTGAVTMAKWFRPIALLTRGFSQMLTSKNPAFMATNFNRDLAEALFYTSGQDPELAAGVVKNLPKMLVIATKNSFSDLTPEERVLFDDFRRSGAKISFNAISDTEGHNREWEKYVPLTAPDKWSKLPEATKKAAGRAFLKVVDGLEKMTQPFEDSIRASVFTSAREIMKPAWYKLTDEQRAELNKEENADKKEAYHKYSVDKSARFAQEATVNFYRKGKWSPYLNGLYAFFNASTQGAATGLRLLKDSKVARLTFMSMVPLSFMLTLRNLDLSDDDPMQKGRKNYNNIAEWQRENSIIIKTGKGQKDYFRIRLPAILTVPWYLGEQAALVMTGQQKASKAVGNVFGNAVNAFNPFGSNSIVGAIAPTLLDPYADILMNKKFSGAPIHPKPEPWNQGIPNSDQAFSTTAPWASTLTKTVYKATNGAVDIYPGDAEHVVSWMFSGLGKSAGNVVTFMNDIRQGKDAKIEDLPIVKTFAPTSWSPATRYYELHDAADAKVNVLREKAKDILKSRSPEKIKEFRDLAAGTGIYFDGEKANTSKSSALKVIRNTDSVLKDLRAKSIAVQNDDKLTPKAKQKQLDDIKLRMERAMVLAGQQMSIFDPRPSFAPLSSWIKK